MAAVGENEATQSKLTCYMEEEGSSSSFNPTT